MASPVAQDKGEITQIEDSLGSELAPAASEDDVLEITTKSPYGEVNFIGTYAALVLSATVAYGGWIMPATSLQYINADIGKSYPPHLSSITFLFHRHTMVAGREG